MRALVVGGVLVAAMAALVGWEACASHSHAPAGPPPVAAVDSGAPLSDELRRAVDADPARALALAEEGERTAPEAPDADERAFHKMQALVALGRIPDARAAARDFFARWPHSPWGARVEQLTGYHRRPLPGPQ